MGFTDSSELIADAVLTDLGKELLARGDGSFKPTSFAFVDTEIDYTLYNISGSSTTAPASILNTPILEANTNESTNEHYELITISDPNVRYLPTIAASMGGTVSEFTSTSGNTQVTLTINQTISNVSSFPAEIIDTMYYVYVNDRFLEVVGYDASLGLDSAYGYFGYSVSSTRTNKGALNGADVLISCKPIDDATWTAYATAGTSSPNRTIITNVKVVGAVSGMTAIVPCTITESA